MDVLGLEHNKTSKDFIFLKYIGPEKFNWKYLNPGIGLTQGLFQV
jgi:hypothetical protein